MAELIGPDAYAAQLQALLPEGRAWPRDRDAALTRLMEALARGLARVDRDATMLLDEVRPDTTTNLLSDWDRIMGLPDACSELESGIAQRRAAILEKLVGQPDPTPDAYIETARKFGLTVSIIEHDQTRAEAIPDLDTDDGRWRFVWWVTVDDDSSRLFSVLSGVSTPLLSYDRNLELECRLQGLSPAHTLLVVGYGSNS